MNDIKNMNMNSMQYMDCITKVKISMDGIMIRQTIQRISIGLIINIQYLIRNIQPGN